MVTLRLADVRKKYAEFAQLLTGCQALLLQALVVLPQVGHLRQQNDFILLLLVVEREKKRRNGDFSVKCGFIFTVIKEIARHFGKYSFLLRVRED